MKIKPFWIGFISLIFLLALVPVLGRAADIPQDETIEIAWEQDAASLPYLSGWSIYVSATPGSGYVKLLDVPYTLGGGPTFTAETILSVTGAPGSTVNRYFVATARNTASVESSYSNEASAAFEIPIPKPGAPFNLIIKVKVN